jgi:hypothetical protein
MISPNNQFSNSGIHILMDSVVTLNDLDIRQIYGRWNIIPKKIYLFTLHTKIRTINTARLSCIKSPFHRPQLSQYTAGCNMAGGKDYESTVQSLLVSVLY